MTSQPEEPKQAGALAGPSQREEKVSLPTEARVSVSMWASQAAGKRNSSITERRLSLHLNRRGDSLQAPGATISQGVVAASDEPNLNEEEHLLKRADRPSAVENEEFVIKSEFHGEMYMLINSNVVGMFFLVVILLNTLSLMAQTSVEVEVRAGWYLNVLDSIFIGIFLAEAVIKIYVFRLRYFLRGWNILDFVIIFFNMVDLLLPIFDANLSTYGATSVFRLLRVMRALRALRLFRILQSFRFFSTLQVILTTIERSAVAMGIIALMMMYVLYLFSVIGRGLYGELDYRFGSIPKTMFTLFLMLTLDDWYFIPMAINEKGVYHSFFFLFIYIFVNVYIFLSLFVAVICDNFENAWLEEKENTRLRKLKHTGSFTNMQEELEEIEEEESLIIGVAATEDEGDDDEDDESNEKTIKEYYPDVPEEQQELMERFFLVAAALENSFYKLMEMQHVLDTMVDVAADASDDTA